ncbi:MAG: S1C family serine protease, partial [Gemmatimonadota bacterium]
MRTRVAVPLLLTLVAFPTGLALGLRPFSGDRNDREVPADGTLAAADPGAIPAGALERGVRPAFASGTSVPSSGIQSDIQDSQDSPRFTPVVAAAARLAPSVVSITVLSTRQVARRSRFDEFFGMVPRQLERQIQGMGSGFALDENGTIITNEHVVSGADSLVVTDVNGRLYSAEVIGTDPITDIAVLRIEAGAIPPAPIGTSSDLVVGEPAIALGNPFGF